MTTLFDAIENGDLRSLRKLMRTGVDLEVIDEGSGEAPLAAAARSGRRDIVEVLLRAGVDPDWGGATTPLEAAAREGRPEVAETLIGAGADVDRPVAGGVTPLIAAASAGNLQVVEILLDAGAKTRVLDDEGASAKTRAEENGHQEIAEILARHDDDVQRFPETVWAALEARSLERLNEILRQKKSDKEHLLAEPGRFGLTPLARAAQLGHVPLVRALVDAGADVDAGGGRTPLHCAVEERHLPVVTALLEAGADVNAPSGEVARTPVMAAAAAGHLETVRFLIERGADPKTTEAELAAHAENRRQMATSAARLIDHVHAGEFDAAKRSLAHGLTDPDGFDEEGKTAMMIAARSGRRDVLRMLIASGASFELRDDADGHTALIHAVYGPAKGRRITLSLLAAAGADLDRPSADGRTPLMHAIDLFLESENGDVAELADLAEPLIHSGADLEARDAHGLTAWARLQERADQEGLEPDESRKRTRAARFLERNGARTPANPKKG